MYLIIELAKFWTDSKNSEIVYKYKLYSNQISFLQIIIEINVKS